MLREGDRVRIRVSICRVRAGTVGTIQHAFRSVSETYSVRFGGDPVPHLVSGAILEPMTEEQGEATED